MRCDLRKGQSSIYVQYRSGGDRIGADRFFADIQGKTLTIEVRVRPVDGNERIDERRLHKEVPAAIYVSDRYIVDRLERFISAFGTSCSMFRLQLSSCGKVLPYSISLGQESAQGLELKVLN